MKALTIAILLGGICDVFIRGAKPLGDVSDFAVVSKSPYFVDKTLFIKDFFRIGQPIKAITAPDGFGKSSLIDMVKKFFSLQVNDRGERVPVNETDNYKLFCERPLEICRDAKFVQEHMGRYPVVSIDYRPLRDIYNFKSTVDRLRIIVKTSFAEHKYLRHYSRLFTLNKSQEFFPNYYDDVGIFELSERKIEFSFYYLTRLLRKYFDKPTIVLHDEYDADCNVIEAASGNLLDAEKIGQFLYSIADFLYEGNDENLERALMMGNRCPNDLTAFRLPYNIQDYRFLDNHEFNRYHGLTSEQVDTMVLKFADSLKNKKYITKERIRREIEEYCECYGLTARDDKVYSLKWIVDYFGNNTRLRI